MDKWAHLGHRLGECWVDADNSITFIPIPKNASSFVKGCLLSSNRFIYRDNLPNTDRYLITLRDPIERWISGVAQFIATNGDNKLNLHDLITRMTFDDHTELQTYFLSGIDIDRCIFLRVDQNLRNNIKQWLIKNGYQVNINLVPNINEGKQTFKNWVTAITDNNHQLKLKLTEHYAQDYELINRVKFYGT
jgi:hypothetical protein